MELNIEQKQAVEHDTGPLLIIAGAGTGKTRAITSRIINLIESGKAKPSEILALTFTEKASNEMIERVDVAMPLGYDELCIKTFHSFADQVLRESGLEMGIDPGYKIMTQVEQWFFFKKHLFDFSLDYYRPLGNPNRFIYSILSHFSRLKDELIKPADYIRHAEDLRLKLEDQMSSGVDLECDPEEAEKMLEIAKVYEQYQNLTIKENYLDFGDLCFYVNELFEKRSSCLKKYQNRYKYILIDEFQDTNYAQFQIVLKLAAGHKNICVVGDDDQSIYKWRGASLSNILQFETHFPESKKVVLNENYRSTGNILDSAYKLIQNNNPDRLEVKIGVNKRLKCNAEGNEKVEAHHFASFIEESTFVAQKIKEIRQKTGAEWNNFAILVRANQLTHPFIDELKYLDIPYQVRNPKGLFSLDEIKDLIAVLRVLANPYDNVAFLRVLKMETFSISMAEILDILTKNGNENIYDILKNLEATLPGIGDGKQNVYELISALIEYSKKEPVGLVINEFLNKSGYLNSLVKRERFEELENINEFAKQVGRFERETADSTVRDFVSYLNLLEEAYATFGGPEFEDRNSVQVLTVHGSKGLEFDYVFVVNMVKQRFPSNRRSEPFEVPEKLTKEIYPEGDFHLEEERRLFYVAITRARKQLFLTYSDTYEGNKKWSVSPFVEEILEENSERACRVEHPAADDAIKRLREFKKPGKSIFELPEFKGTRLSYSQLDTFKMCPLKYNYRYLMKVPTAQAHAANFGNSVHKTLNDFYLALKQGQKVDLEFIQKLYEKNWIPYGYESKDHEMTRKTTGWEILKNYYEKNGDPWVIPAFLEQPFNIKIAEHWFMGRIDRIDKLADGTYEVIDYKTGAVKESKEVDKDMQLSLYALACRDVLRLPVSKLSLYYLEDNQKISTTRDEKKLKALMEDVQGLIEQVKTSDFSPTPGFHCQFCDYKLICPVA